MHFVADPPPHPALPPKGMWISVPPILIIFRWSKYFIQLRNFQHFSYSLAIAS